jgi:hypothetical protein
MAESRGMQGGGLGSQHQAANNLSQQSAPIGNGGSAAQDVVVRGKPVQGDNGTIKVTYNPGPGDPQETEIFGKKVKAGEAADIPAKHAHKIAGNPYLSTEGKKDMATPQNEPAPIEELSFEQELARERSTEYLEGRALPPSPPGEADRLARAMEAAAELKAAVESDDTDKPRRGRPPTKRPPEGDDGKRHR